MKFITLFTTFKGRISRLEFFHGIIAIVVLAIGLSMLESYLVVLPTGEDVTLMLFTSMSLEGIIMGPFNFTNIQMLQWLVVLPLMIILNIFSYALLIKRLHDVGRKGWYSVFSEFSIFAPALILALLWFKGEPTKNIYGEPREVVSPGVRS